METGRDLLGLNVLLPKLVANVDTDEVNIATTTNADPESMRLKIK